MECKLGQRPTTGPEQRRRPFIRPMGRQHLGRVAGLLVFAALLSVGPAQAALRPDSAGFQAPYRAASQGPPLVRITTDSVALSLRPFTSCWSSGHTGMCYDGIPLRPLPSTGSTQRPLALAFPRDGWRFTVTVTDAKGHRTRLHVVRTSAQSWRLVLKGLADGRYRASVFGRGPQGDVAAAFAFFLR